MIEIREFAAVDYDSVRALWLAAPGIVLRDVDARESLTAYIERNQGLSFVALDGERLSAPSFVERTVAAATSSTWSWHPRTSDAASAGAWPNSAS